MHIPTATYRLQFNPTFGFTQAKQLIPYIKKLGISDVYASPIFKARRGSMHGYDVTNPSCLNPELGCTKTYQRHRIFGHESTAVCNSPYITDNDFFMVNWFRVW